MPFYTRPNFEDRQIVQYTGNTITLSGQTNISNLGQFVIQGPILDFTGTTSASTLYTIAGVSGYINYGNVSSFKIQPPLIIQSGGTGTTTVDVTGYILSSLDADGNIVWSQPVDINISGFTYNDANKLTILNNNGSEYSVYLNQFSGLTINGSVSATTYYGDGSNLTGLASNDFYVTGGTYVGTTLTLERQNGSVVITGFTSVFTGNTSGDCITDLFVSNVNSCSPLHIQNISSGDVLIGENDGVNVGIGTSTPTAKLHINNTTSGNTFLAEDDTNPDSTPFVIDNNGNVGIGTSVPSEKLHVSGNTKITGGLNIGTIGSGSPLINLDSLGNVVTGTTGGGGGTFTGGTVTGPTNFTNGLTANTFNTGSLVINGITYTAITDTFVTGFTYNDTNKLTISRNQGQPNLDVFINVMSGLTINGNLVVTGNTILQSLSATSVNTNSLTLNNVTITGFTSYDYVFTGGTVTGPTNFINGLSATSVNTNSLIVNGITYTAITDTFVTGFTYNDANRLTISRNQGQSDLNVFINTFSGLTVNGTALINGDVNILGNVNVIGTATTLNTQVVQTRDNKILLNYSGTTLSAIGGGIEILSAKTDGNNVSLTTDIYGDWNSNTGLNINGRTNDSTSYGLNIQNSDGTSNFVVRNDGYVGIGTESPTQKLHVSGNTLLSDEVNGDLYVLVDNKEIGGINTRTAVVQRVVAESTGTDFLVGSMALSGYETDLSGSGFGDNGTGYLKNAFTMTLAGSYTYGSINIGTRGAPSMLRFFSGNQNFNSTSLRGSLNSNGNWGFGQNMTGQTAIVHIKGGGSGGLTNSLKIDNSSNSPLLYVRDNGNVGIGVENPTEKLHVSGNTKITGGLNIGTIGSGSPIINLGLDSNGNVVTGTTVGSDITSLGTGLTIHFSGKTVFNLPTSPASGNISGDTTNAKFGMIQKIYHQSAVEPTFPATWNLVGEGVYFTNELNIIYAEYVTNTWIEYWIIQIQ